MPHYKDGTEAKVGDTVKGQVYNEKSPDGSPAVLVGTLIGIVPGSGSCNARVAWIRTREVPQQITPDMVSTIRALANGIKGCGAGDGSPSVVATLEHEYTQCDYLEKLSDPIQVK